MADGSASAGTSSPPRAAGPPARLAAPLSWQPGLWRLPLFEHAAVVAGITDRTLSTDPIEQTLSFAGAVVSAGQVHGASLAAIESSSPSSVPIPGCDGLASSQCGLALVIRSADCLPLFAWDPVRRVIALAHVGWRGLARHLPIRLVTFLRALYHSRPRDLRIGIGPSIRVCCYDVGPEFEQLFPGFIHSEGQRRTCDLVACTLDQLQQAGIVPVHVAQTGECTACGAPTGRAERWWSMRRGAQPHERLYSFIVMPN